MNFDEFQIILMKSMSEYRIQNNLTQAEIANNIGISRSYYSDIENGRKFPSPNILSKINEEGRFFYITMTPIE